MVCLVESKAQGEEMEAKAPHGFRLYLWLLCPMWKGCVVSARDAVVPQ